MCSGEKGIFETFGGNLNMDWVLDDIKVFFCFFLSLKGDNDVNVF